MKINSQKPISKYLILKIVFPVIIIYGVFFFFRANGIQPITEAMMGDFITAMYFIFSAAVAYFMFILQGLGYFQSVKPSMNWWLGAFYFLLFLAYDEIFLIHEWICFWLNIRDIYLFALYGLVLAGFFYAIRIIITRPVFYLLGIFVFLGAVAVLADTFLGEGVITISGRVVGFEQLAESFASLILSAAFVTIAVQEMAKQFFKISSETVLTQEQAPLDTSPHK